MCDTRPGNRCSDYATSTLAITKKRLERITNELSSYEEKYADSLDSTENPSPRDIIRQNKHKRLKESSLAHQKVVDGAEFDYYSCPVGQAEMAEDLKAAIEAEDVPLQEELKARIEAGKEYRARNAQNLKDLEDIEAAEGPEAAYEESLVKYEEATEVETEATIQVEKSAIELEAARAEAAEYQRAMEEYRKNDRIDTPEEELAKARKRKMQILVIGTIAAAVLAYTMTRQAATGEKSQLLQYGKSMAMRQVMTGGRQFIMPLLKGGAKEEDAREMRAEREAEQRAALARERILKKHEKESEEEDRRSQRDEERAAEAAHRNALREEERESERQRRAEELAHYQKLAEQFKDIPLTPEMQEEIDSKKPQRRPRSGRYNEGKSRAPGGRRDGNSGNRENNENNGNRQQSTKKRTNHSSAASKPENVKTTENPTVAVQSESEAKTATIPEINNAVAV